MVDEAALISLGIACGAVCMGSILGLGAWLLLKRDMERWW